MRTTLRRLSIALLIAATIAAYAVIVIGTGETLSAPTVDEAQATFLTPAAADTLAMYSPPPDPALLAEADPTDHRARTGPMMGAYRGRALTSRQKARWIRP